MSSDHKKKLVREFLELLHSGQADAAVARLTENASFIVFNNEMPGGIRGFAAMVPMLFKDGPHREFTAQYADGDTVVSEITVRGVTNNDSQYQNYYLIICHFDGDKISGVREYLDSAYAAGKFSFPQ
jgi:ketosteroid isomerase-like protein